MLDDAWRAVVELAASQHRAFTRAQAAARRIDDRRLKTAVRQGFVVPHGRDVFTFGPPAGLVEWARVGTLLGAGSIASHRTAASFFGMLDVADGAKADVLVPPGRWLRVPEGVRVVAHQTSTLPKRDLVVFDGIPCTTKQRTLVDLAAVVDTDTLTKALIAACVGGTSLAVVRETAARLVRPGRSGAARLLRLLDTFAAAGVVPESWLEEVLRRILDRPDLPPLVSHYRLHDRRGRFVARFDHAFPEVRLAVEGHSRRFHFGPVKESVDEQRDLRAARCGWQILYLGWYASRRPAEVVDAIADVVAARRPQRPVTPIPQGRKLS